jgi:hypothetical protein
MTQEAQRIAIAEECIPGFDKATLYIGAQGHTMFADMSDQTGTTALELPDYLNDLNAIHSAVLSQGPEFQQRFDAELRRCVYTGYFHNMTAETWAACFIACLTTKRG